MPHTHRLRADGLAWLARRDRRFQRRDGTPNVHRIAIAADINPPTLTRNLTGELRANGDLMASLVTLAMQTGAPRYAAYVRLFSVVPAGMPEADEPTAEAAA